MVDYRDLLLEPLIGPDEEGDLTSKNLSDLLICECHVVGMFHLRDLVLEAGKVDLELLKKQTGLGSGCGTCLKMDKDWIRTLEKLV
ncbi:MAG: (2Fe-2S)-binding protein [Bacteriovoracaceae bacterium]